MNRIDGCLQRLFRAAARVEPEVPVEAPFGLETRVLAAWRRGQGEVAEDGILLLPLFQRAFICACAILAISAAVSLYSLNDAPHELVIVDSVIHFTLMQ